MIPAIGENGFAEGRGQDYGQKCLRGGIYYQAWLIEEWRGPKHTGRAWV